MVSLVVVDALRAAAAFVPFAVLQFWKRYANESSAMPCQKDTNE
jgi:hypothetical protein